MLLHGLASHKGIWDLVAPILTTKSNVIAFDLRGHGMTSKEKQGYDFNTIASDVKTTCDSLGLEHPILVGHSWGGNVALHCAVHYPELVSGLIMVDGGFIEPSSVPNWTWEKAKVAMAPPIFHGITIEAIKERIRTGHLAPYMNPSIENILFSNFTVTAEGFAVPKLSRENHMKIVWSLWKHKPSHLFQKVQCPALIIPTIMHRPTGAMEMCKEYLITRASRLLSKGKVIWMHETVHDAPLQRPETLAALISGFANEPF